MLAKRRDRRRHALPRQPPAQAGSPSSLLPLSGLGISTRRTACGLYRPPSICARTAGQCSRAWAGKASMVTPSMPGAPLLAFTRFHARTRLSLDSTACSRSWVVVASSCFKARCVPPAGASFPGGVIDAVEAADVCSLCLVVQPFSGPTPGRLLRRLLTSAP